MRKTLTFEGKRHVYDTNKATEIGRHAQGEFGDPAGYEEIAYRTRSGYYFILGIGGSASPYAEQEVIKPCSKEEAEALA